MNDPASALHSLLSGFVSKQFAGLHVAFPCRVVTFDEQKGTASVQPLLRTSESAPAVIQNVPALGQRLLIGGVETVCKPALKAGDAVMVLCADREIKNTLSGKLSSPDSGRMHDLNDAVIVGVLPCSL